MAPKDRLEHVYSTLVTPPPTQPLLGTLSLGALSVPIYSSPHPLRLPHSSHLLDLTDPSTASNLEWLLKKSILGQDVFLYGAPGPYARRIAMTYAAMMCQAYEVVALHRDVGESELKQGREIRAGGKLEYVDSPAVRAVKMGSILILDGIERCERGILPILNNLLENREINLEDGTHIVSADRYELMVKNKEDTRNFIPAHRNFRVIAIGTPVPPYPGFPLDPPFRSRFQCRYIDTLSTSQILARPAFPKDPAALDFVQKTSNAITSLQIMKEMRLKMASGISSDDVPPFPQTALIKLAQFLSTFPPPHPSQCPPSQMSNLLLSIHPALAYITPASWRSLETAFEGAGLGEFVEGIAECDPTEVITSQIVGEGIFGWVLSSISRVDATTALVSFTRGGTETISVKVPSGPLPFAPFPLTATPTFHVTPRFLHLLTSLFQLHSLNTFDISFLPPSSSLQSSSSSTTILISTFASLLGYKFESIHLYKELGGREIWMRRVVKEGGVTVWEPSPMVKGAWDGMLVHLEGLDTIGATTGSLARLLNEREGELWEGKRLVSGEPLTEEEKASGVLTQVHPSFRVIATSSKSSPPREWLTEELSSIFFSLPTIAMSLSEESAILTSYGCPPLLVTTIENFARSYRRMNSAPASKSRRLGTASLVRIARRLAQFPKEGSSLFAMINRALLSEFLPSTTKAELATLLSENGIKQGPEFWNPPPEVNDTALVFPASSDPNGKTDDYVIPLYDMSIDPTGSSHVPFMNNYLDNSQQTILMRDIATDLEIMGEHVLLLGNQGVGKNKIVDRLLQLLKRPREFVQLHRDSTTQSLMFQTSLAAGVINYTDSPLLRAIKYGRVIVIDEVDKAAAPVVAALASLAARGEMTLADGRRVRPPSDLPGEIDSLDVIVHPGFRMILLANRPGFPFLGNPFLRVLGDAFSCHAVTNPDADSEERVLSQLAPDVDIQLLRSLVLAFGDLRKGFENGSLSYPFSLRELIAVARHIKAFPDDPLEQTLRNVFDFDIARPETLDALYDILRKHKLAVARIGIDAVRVGSKETKKPVVIDFKPTGDTSLSDPKYGKDTEKAHKGGNTWAGGTGGRSTAGLGGRGGYMRLYKGHDIHQVSDALKADVPDEIKNQARDMARKELAARLAQIDLTNGEASTYSGYHDSVQSHVHQLVTFLDNLEANEEERIWLKRTTDGELDETRLTEGLTGEAAVYKRRGMEKPELGRPQLKPKRLRFIFDLSASMYRNQYDGRLTRSLEAATMILESFSRLSRKEKYRVDIVGQSGEEAVIPLVPLDHMPADAGERYRIIQKMAVIPQYTWAGDHTIEAIEAGVTAVVDSDSDDYFVIVITDANFERYGITPDDLKRAMDSNPKVRCSLIAIGEGAESEWLPKALPGRAYRVKETSDISRTLRQILGNLLGGAGLL